MLILNALSGFGGRRRVSGGGGGVTLTSADVGGFGVIFGFCTASSPNNFTPGTPNGSISGQPVVGQTLVEVFDTRDAGGNSWVTFSGDIVAALAGLKVWLNGVQYPFDIDWYHDSGYTYGEWTGTNGPLLKPAGAYPGFEIK